MANELQTVLPPLLDTVLPNSQGNISLDINNLLMGNQIGQLTVKVQSSDIPPPLLEPNNAQIEFDRKYYNIFVVGDDFDITACFTGTYPRLTPYCGQPRSMKPVITGFIDLKTFKRVSTCFEYF